MSTEYSARKLLDRNAKKQKVKFISSKVHRLTRPRRPRCETVNTSAHKTGGRKVEFREDEKALAPGQETVQCTKIPVGEVRPPRSRTQATMLGHLLQPRVTSQRKKIPDCQTQLQTHRKPRHPRTQTLRSETLPKRSKTPVTAQLPEQLSCIQREQLAKSSNPPAAENGTYSREAAARNQKPSCIPPRNNYPRNTTSRVLGSRSTRKPRPVTNCAYPASRYGSEILNWAVNKFVMFACLFLRTRSSFHIQGSTFKVAQNSFQDFPRRRF